MPRLENHPRLSAALTVLMAVAALVLAWGHQTATLAHASVGGATGPLVADSLGGGAILSARNMVPGSARVGEVTVTNDGDTEGGMSLKVADVSNVMSHGLALSSLLDLTVVDVTAGRAPGLVYSGKLDELSGVALGTYQQNEAHRYRFLVSYPETADDDTYSASSASVSFVWTATQNDAPPPPATPPAADVPVAPAGGDPATIVDTVQQSTNPGALKLRVYVRRTQAAHRKRVYVNVFCSRACTLTATGVGSLPSRHWKWKLKTLKGKKVKAGGTMKFKMPLPKWTLKPLDTALRQHKRASVTLKITATTGKQTVRWTRTIRLAR